MDQLEEAQGFIESIGAFFEFVANLYARQPIFTVAIIAFLCFLLYFHVRALFREWKIEHDSKLRIAVVLAGSIAIAVIVAVSSSTLNKQQLVHVTPEPDETIFGPRVYFSWESPDEPVGARAYLLEIRQGNKIDRFESNLPNFSLRLWNDDAFEEGEFQWRVSDIDSEYRWSEWQSNDLYQNHLSRISLTNTLRVGLMSEELAPYTYTDYERGESEIGIEVDVARLIAGELGERLGVDLNVQFFRSPWLVGNVFDIQSNRVDIVFANMTQIPDREEQYQIRFSRPYYQTPLGLVWTNPEFDEQFYNIDMNGRNIIAWDSGTSQRVVRALRGNLITGDSTAQMLYSLDRGEVDAIVDDALVLACELLSAPESEYRFVRIEEMPARADSLNFDYPDRIAPYVSSHVSVSGLKAHIDTIMDDEEIQRNIEEIFLSYACD